MHSARSHLLSLVLNSLYTIEFLHLVQYNEPGMVHCKYQGDTGLNIANSTVESLMKCFTVCQSIRLAVSRIQRVNLKRKEYSNLQNNNW